MQGRAQQMDGMVRPSSWHPYGFSVRHQLFTDSSSHALPLSTALPQQLDHKIYACLVKLGCASHPHLFELIAQYDERIHGGLHLS